MGYSGSTSVKHSQPHSPGENRSKPQVQWLHPGGAGRMWPTLIWHSEFSDWLVFKHKQKKKSILLSLAISSVVQLDLHITILGCYRRWGYMICYYYFKGGGIKEGRHFWVPDSEVSFNCSSRLSSNAPDYWLRAMVSYGHIYHSILNNNINNTTFQCSFFFFQKEIFFFSSRPFSVSGVNLGHNLVTCTTQVSLSDGVMRSSNVPKSNSGRVLEGL